MRLEWYGIGSIGARPIGRDVLFPTLGRSCPDVELEPVKHFHLALPSSLSSSRTAMNTNTAVRTLSRVSQTLIKQHHAPFRIPQLPQPRTLHTIGLRRPFPSTISRVPPQIRYHSTESTSESSQRPLTDRSSSQSDQAAEIAARKAEQPSYQLTFTCKACSERSSHHITKQAYHFGTTLITCPGCKNRHLISDHLKIFSDTSVTLEDIMKEKGQLLRKGRLGEDGDIEFYDPEKVSEVLGGPKKVDGEGEKV